MEFIPAGLLGKILQNANIKNRLTNTINKIYNRCTVVRISYHVVYHITKDNLQTSGGLGSQKTRSLIRISRMEMENKIEVC